MKRDALQMYPNGVSEERHKTIPKPSVRLATVLTRKGQIVSREKRMETGGSDQVGLPNASSGVTRSVAGTSKPVKKSTGTKYKPAEPSD